MNTTAAVLFLAFAGLAVVAAGRWVSRLPLFDLQGISVTGDVNHNNAATLRANVAPGLAGTFFTVDLARVRSAFEAVPWVRHAVVRREFPNRLRVDLQEHLPVAYWGGESESRLINAQGEVFEANVGEVEQEGLPRLSGPEGQSAEVLAMYRTLAPLFQGRDIPLEQLDLTGRGSWRARLDTGASLELGRGSVDDVDARTQRFLKTLTQVTSRYARPLQALESADLRYENGYALRLRGVSTLAADGPKKK
ncbi:cell division protein FtsQ/DivIB [uncultured Rhodoferax sp.]|uniref:cell division protein FtsQ/DivIB n=1 Tax=uncultured Rhodoferax sp. TaxID=223188 RepID=UPI0025D4C86C|nr:cell division protein FtsQ/DivIB [uncultured Rhodoferax sp.]